jgi:hypothetical protein
MHVPAETQRKVEDILSLIMERDSARRFADLDNSLSAIKESDPSWHGYLSLSLYLSILHGQPGVNVVAFAVQDTLQSSAGDLTDALETLRWQTADVVFGHLFEEKPSQALRRYVWDLSDASELARARISIHKALALASAWVAVERYEEASKLSKLVNVVVDLFLEQEAPKILSPRVGWLVDALARTLLLRIRRSIGDHIEAVMGVADLAGSEPVWDWLLEEGRDIIEEDLEECEKTGGGWFMLCIAADAILRAATLERRCSRPSPAECALASASYWAWYLGRLIGLWALRVESLADEVEDLLQTGLPLATFVVSLLIEACSERNWQATRDQYLSVWKSLHPSALGLAEPIPISPDVGDKAEVQVERLGPTHELYWAARIGFVDGIQEAGKIAPRSLTERMPSYIEGLYTMLSRTVLETMKTRRIAEETHRTAEENRRIAEDLKRWQEEHHPPGPTKARALLAEKLGESWDKLPAPAQQHLMKAWQCYCTQVNDDEATLNFAKAVEACFHSYFVEPLIKYMNKFNMREIGLPEHGKEQRPEQIKKLSLSQWAAILSQSMAPRGWKETLSPEFRNFLEERFGLRNSGAIQPLCEALREVHRYRGGSAHYQDVTSRLSRSTSSLEKLRKIVLGEDGRKSILGLIVEVLGPKPPESA